MTNLSNVCLLFCLNENLFLPKKKKLGKHLKFHLYSLYSYMNNLAIFNTHTSRHKAKLRSLKYTRTIQGSRNSDPIIVSVHQAEPGGDGLETPPPAKIMSWWFDDLQEDGLQRPWTCDDGLWFLLFQMSWCGVTWGCIGLVGLWIPVQAAPKRAWMVRGRTDTGATRAWGLVWPCRGECIFLGSHEWVVFGVLAELHKWSKLDDAVVAGGWPLPLGLFI